MKHFLIILLLLVSTVGFSQEDVRKNAVAFSKGLECKYKEDVQGAIKNFEEALQYMPDDAASMFELSEQYVKAGRADEGFAMIKKAAELDPDNKWYQMRLAIFHRTFQQMDDYIAIYERLTAKYPGDIALLSDLIDAYLIKENYDKAIEKLDLLEQQAGVSTLVSEQKLDIYKRQGNTKKVISEMERLIAENPENTRYLAVFRKVSSGSAMRKKDFFVRVMPV